jgi:hypothetical protein
MLVVLGIETAFQTHINKRLYDAVFAACGWPSDLSDEEILERLLALNLELSKAAIICRRSIYRLGNMPTLARHGDKLLSGYGTDEKC